MTPKYYAEIDHGRARGGAEFRYDEPFDTVEEAKAYALTNTIRDNPLIIHLIHKVENNIVTPILEWRAESQTWEEVEL